MNPANVRDIELPERSPIKSIRVLRAEPTGIMTTVAVYERRGGSRRKVSKRYRGIEKLVRRMTQAQQAATSEYLVRHDTANSRKKDGWMKRFSRNTEKAMQKGRKKLKLRFR